MNRIKLRRILKEAMRDLDPITGETKIVEQAEVEDVLFECICDWMVRSPTPSRQGGDLFTDFTDAVAKKLGLPDSVALKEALEDIMFR